MKFRCERDSLVEVLATGRAHGGQAIVLPDGPERPAHRDRGQPPVRWWGTDLDLTVHVSTEAIGITDGVCVAPAKLLADIVRSLEPGAVTIEAEGEKVEIGRGAFALQPAHASRWTDFPSLPGAARPGRRSCPPAASPGALRQVVRACVGRRRPTAADRCARSPRGNRRPPAWRPTPTGWPCGDLEGSDAFVRARPRSSCRPGPWPNSSGSRPSGRGAKDATARGRRQVPADGRPVDRRPRRHLHRRRTSR